ncbi:titin isoform X24 [Daktulosphaira vitifoliae]|uniref:titin isoform X24 n=1 Tax=Daktulosphaira vitifoliae TaxID=58002 RepID=UPI0021A9F04A|nr:titin isoform X24 [Daktulosphaira vitifoliae]
MFKSTKKTKDPTKSSNTKNLKVSENNIMTERDSVEQKQLFSSKVANEQPTNLSGKGRSSTPQTSKKTLVKSIASKQESETKSSSIERLSSSSSTTTTAVSGKTIKTTTTVDKDGNIRTHVETVEDLPKKTTNTTGDKLSTINLSTQSSGGQVNLFGSSMNNTDVSQKVFSETRHNSSIIGDETSSTLSLNSLKLPNTAKDITQNDDFYSVKLVNGKIIKSLNTKNDISDGLLLNKKSNKETHIKESEKSTSKIINEPLVQQKRISQLEESEVQIKSDDIKSNTENSKIKSHDKLFTNNNITISSDNSQPNQSNKNLSTLKSVSNKMDNNSLNVSNFVASAQSSYTSSKKETQKSDFLTLRNSKTLSMKNEQSLPKIQTTSSSSTEVEQIDTDRLSVRMIGGKLIKEFKEPASVTKTKSNFNNKSLSSDFNTFTTNEQSSFSNVEETSESSSISSKVSQNIKNAKFDKNDKSKTKSKVITENTSLTTNDNTKVGGLNIRMVGDKLIEDFKDIKPSSNKKSLPNNFSTTLKTSEQSSISNTIKGTNELSSMSSKTSQYINNSNFDKKDKFLCNKESKENTENIFSAKSTEKEGLTVRMVGGKLIKSFKEPTNQKIVKSNTNIDTTILSNNINTIVTNEKSYFSSSKEENEMSNSITSKISNSMDKIPFDKKKEPKTQTKNLLLNSTISLVNLDDENLSVENTFSTTNESTEKETVRMVGGELMKSFKEPSNRVRTTYNVSDSAHSLNDTSLYSTSSTLHAQSTKIADIQISSASKDTLIKDDQPNASNEKDFKNQSRPQVKPRKINKEPADFSNDITDNIVHSQIYDASQNTFVQSHTFSDESVVQGFHFTSKSSEFFSDSPTINHNLIDTTVVQDVTNIVSDTNIAEVLDSRVVLENVLKKSTISKLEQNLENRSTSEYTARENKSNTGSKKKQKETTTVTKEQCICEICTCGRHRCSHTPGTDGPLLSLESSTIPKLSTTKEEYQPIPLDLIDRPTLHRLNTELTLNEGIIENKTAYRTEFDKKHAERQLRYKLIDQIHLEGDYLPKKHQDFPGVPGDRFLPYKPQDNLKPEGEFERPIRPKVETVERPKLIKPNDNLKPEGDFNRPIPTKVQSADRPLPIKPKDNLRPEGQFDRPLKPQYGPGERAPIVKHPDNLKPEGEFEKPSPSIYAPGDRAPIKKHSDNLKPEGVFYGERAITIVAKGERAEIRRHEDQLVIGGEFTDLTTQKVEFTGEASERPRMIRRNTWTKLEGEILMSPKNKEEYPKQPIIKIEKGKKKNDTLNITSGEFYTNTSSQEAYQRHNITKTNIIKKCSDNLVCEGQMNFETSISSEFTPKSTNIEKPVRRRTWTKQDGEIFFQTTTSEIFKKHNKYDIRQEIIKHTDNLKMEGMMNNTTHSKEQYKNVKAEIPNRIKPKDNLRSEGDFERPTKEQYRSAERPKQIKPRNNLKLEGDFQKPQTKIAPKTDKRKLIKPKDTLKPEGDFQRPQPEEFQPAERPKQVKPQDNLYPEGKFERPELPEYSPAERPKQIKPFDNLKPEGEFERPVYEKFKPSERPTPFKPTDNLKPEGEFPQRIKETVGPGDRAPVVKPKDNLFPEGDFQRPQPEEFQPAERPKQVKPQDNLYPEGKFERPELPEYSPAERPKQVKPQDNLYPEGKFERPELPEYSPAERPKQIKPFDNLKPEGEFERPVYEKFKPSERPTPFKPTDNLKPEGEFPQRIKETVGPGDRAPVVKPKDNLFPEGDFQRPQPEEFQPAERPKQVKPQDNLYPEGKFERPELPEYSPAERPKQIKPFDNLKPEGEFERPVYEKFKPSERPTPFKPTDNLKPEGEFPQRIKETVGPGDRAPVVKPKDNLFPEGDFQRPQPEEFQPAERPKQVKPQDNLYPEGKFERPELPEYSPAERPKQIKPFDNLKPEGEFERPVYEKFKPSERPTPFKPTDNLKPEGEFPQRIKETVGPGDRAPVVKPKDNLFPEGDFQRPQPEEFQPAERPKQVKPQDNLYPEGKFERPELPEYSPAERPKQIKPFDNLKPEGEFERPVYEKFKPSERPTPFKPTDNLKPEGEFPQRIKETVGPGDRAPVVKPKDNLDIVGEHYMCRKDDYDFKRVEHQKIIRRSDNLSLDGELIDMNRRMDYSFKHGERRNLVHHSDNLKIEGKFVDMNYKNDFVQHNIKQEVNVIKHHDNLKLEGKFAKRFVQEVVSGERAPVVKPKDNLKPEGDFERPSRNGYSPAERPKQVRHPDNLKPEGDFAKRVPEKVGPGERAPVVKPKDNLKPEGDFERPSRNGYSPAERPKQVRHPDNLKPEGDFAKRVPEKVGPGERAPIVKPKDNLKPEGDFERPSRNGYSPAERPKQVRHPDNLKPEGDFAKRVPEKVGPGERAPIVKPKDNLKPEGDFERPSRNGYSPAERPKQVRHPDNLKPEGDFAKRVPEKVGPGERAPIVKPKDNLKPEGDFERPSRNGYSPAERPKQVRHLDNLKLEGEFERRVVQNVKCVERPHVIKPLDNLRMEGDFVKRENMYSTRKLEQAIIRKHVDNLKLEGNMHYEHKNIHAESKINQIQLSNSQQNIHSSRIEAAANTLVNNQQIINSSLHGRSQILSDLKNDSNTSHNRLVKQDHTKFGVDNLEFKQSSDMSFRKSLKSDEHNEKVERKKWETTQKRDYLRSSVNNLDLSGKITSSKQYTHKIGDNRYAEDTTNHHFYHSHHQATQSHTQKSTRLINEQASSSKNESDATTQIRNNDLEKSKYTLKKNTEQSNKQSRLYDISSTQNSALSTQQNSSSSLDNISQQSQVESNLNASVSQISNNKSPIRRPESFVIDLKSDLRSDLKSQNDRFMSISRISKESTQDQINRQIFKSESNDENKNKGTKTYEYNTNDYQLSTADGLLNKNYLNHSHTDSRESMYDSNISHKKSSHTSKQTNEIKNYSTATYRKSLHSTTSNVLNLDTVVMDRKNYSDESHHRKSVISSNTDLSNSVLHRKGDVTIIEAPHTTSTAAAAQRKSINTLDSGFVSIAQDNRNSLSSMHRHERVTKSSNRSHITLGDTSITSNISHYKNEYKPRVTGPCPVPLIERNQAPFKHTRDTKSHKFYKYTSTTEGDRK